MGTQHLKIRVQIKKSEGWLPTMLDSKVGLKIKEIRLAQKMTLKELSEKTDLSISFLSMVERGITSATLVSLNKIANAFNVDLSTFFIQSGATSSTIFFHSYDNHIRSISGHYIYSSLSPFNEKFSFDPMMITFLPGQQREDIPLITHAGEDFVYVLEGVLTYFLNGQEFTLYPGDGHHGFGNQPHNFANLSNNIVKVLYIISPPLPNGEETRGVPEN